MLSSSVTRVISKFSSSILLLLGSFCRSVSAGLFGVAVNDKMEVWAGLPCIVHSLVDHLSLDKGTVGVVEINMCRKTLQHQLVVCSAV